MQVVYSRPQANYVPVNPQAKGQSLTYGADQPDPAENERFTQTFHTNVVARSAFDTGALYTTDVYDNDIGSRHPRHVMVFRRASAPLAK